MPGKLAQDGPGAGDRLEAAEPAAATGVTVRPDRRMANLTGAEAVALEQPPAEDEPGADPFTDLDDDEVREPRPAEDLFGKGDRLAVVRDVDRQAGPSLKECAQG